MNKDRPVVPSRRAVVRAAAWTAPAVVMVGAAPAWATSGQELTGRVVGGDIKRRPERDDVVWEIKIAVEQALEAGCLSVTFSGVSAVVGLRVASKKLVWTGDDLSRRVYPNAVAAGEQITLEATFSRSDNASNETATATFTGTGMSGQIVVTGSY